MSQSKLLKVAGTLLMCGAGLSAQAAGEPAASGESVTALEEVVVTAEKRETDLQHTSVSVGVVSGREIEMQGITQLDDALKNIVGVVVTRSGFTSSPTIRGVGPTIETTNGGSAGVSSLFDGVYTQNNYSSRLGYYDVARVQVLRGPQGTLYGRNSEGGVVELISNDPTHKFEGAASATMGNYSQLNVSGMLNIPLSDALALRVATSSVDRKGYLSNGQDDNRAQGMRAKLLYQPSADFSLLFGAETARLSGEGPGTSLASDPFRSVVLDPTDTAFPPSRTIATPSAQIDEDNTYKVWAKLIADVGIGQLTVLPAYQYQSEPKQLLYTGLVALESPGTGSTIERSAEVRLASEPGSYLSWVGGFYRYHYHQTTPGQYATTVNSAGNVVVNPNPGTAANSYGFDDSTGVFGQATLPISDRWRLIAGIRHSKDEKTSLFESPGENPRTLALEVPQNATWSKTDWKAGTEFDVNTTSMLYATVSTGYRAGGFSPNYPHTAYAPENLKSYELGLKNQFLDNKLRVNADVYDYDYQNYQQANLQCAQFIVLPNGVTICPNFNFGVINVGKVSVRGLELESAYVPTPNDSLTANLALQHSRIDSAVLYYVYNLSGTQLQGSSLPNAPKVTFSSSYRHAFHVGNIAIAPQVGPRYSSETETLLASAASTQKAWWQWDASLQFAPDAAAWSVNAYVKNATNTVVKTSYILTNGPALVTLASPRTYGVSVSARF
ncbi:MAG: TonB-dependent receptor [Pseudomonadota bacterium]|nr:TonB-dependent receptor [Pseudomonadota bacterium]